MVCIAHCLPDLPLPFTLKAGFRDVEFGAMDPVGQKKCVKMGGTGLFFLSPSLTHLPH